MRAIKQFNEFIEQGIVKKQTPDKQRAGFLVSEAEREFNYIFKLISKLGIENENANDIIKNCYDIILGIIRAKMLMQGYNASGQGAHESEVSYLRTLGFDEKDVQFLDQIRYFRNGMLYYGKRLDKEYAEKVIEFTKKIYPMLKP